MSEAKEGCAFLEGVDESTFVRFSEFAYTEDYVSPDPEVRLENPRGPNRCASIYGKAKNGNERKKFLPGPDDLFFVDPPAYSDSSDGITPMKRKREIIRKVAKAKSPVIAGRPDKSELYNRFKRKEYGISDSAFKNRETSDNYSEIFLCHARLYVFADRYAIAPLRSLSLHKLHQILLGFTLNDERIDDVVNLIQYTYSNTVSLSESTDDLRILVTLYAAHQVEMLGRNDNFSSLLEEHGAFGKDLLKQMLGRLDWEKKPADKS